MDRIEKINGQNQVPEPPRVFMGNIKVMALLVKYRRSPGQLLGTYEGWVPALVYVRLNEHTKHGDVVHVHTEAPEISDENKAE